MISIEALQSVLTAKGDDSGGSNTSPSVSGGSESQNAQANNAAINRLTIALACTTCRGRHLKCDGKMPCSRCRTDGVECLYVKSRRGYKGPRRAKSSNSPPRPNGAVSNGNGIWNACRFDLTFSQEYPTMRSQLCRHRTTIPAYFSNHFQISFH